MARSSCPKPPEAQHTQLDWLIVGGGPHGVHLACRLLDRDVDPAQIAILDPHSKPLARWKHQTHNTGMLHLRSPKVHHLEIDPHALSRHAEAEGFLTAKRDSRDHRPDTECDFIPPYFRPSLRLFNHHAQRVVDGRDLMKLWRTDRAQSIQPLAGGYRVHTRAGHCLDANNLVLAIGAGDHLNWPHWALEAREQEGATKSIHHIFAPSFRREQVAEDDDVAVVGAGISAAQLALALHGANPRRRVLLISRHFLRKEDFDSDPGWLGPTRLEEFHDESCYVRRRSMIQGARNRGSMSSEVTHRLQTALLQGEITLELAEIERAVPEGTAGRLHLHIRPVELDAARYSSAEDLVFQFSDQTRILQADTVVLATGFQGQRPGGPLLDEAIRSLDLPVAPDGYPIVDRHLCWREGLFVTGPLAELEVGPASRNLSGARMAGRRIIDSPRAHGSAGPNDSFLTCKGATPQASSVDSATGAPRRPRERAPHEPDHHPPGALRP